MNDASSALSENPIPADTLARVMTAATYAPSCFNSRSWGFMVINEPETLPKAKEALTDGNYLAKKAPVLVVGVTKFDYVPEDRFSISKLHPVQWFKSSVRFAPGYNCIDRITGVFLLLPPHATRCCKQIIATLYLEVAAGFSTLPHRCQH